MMESPLFLFQYSDHFEPSLIKEILQYVTDQTRPYLCILLEIAQYRIKDIFDTCLPFGVTSEQRLTPVSSGIVWHSDMKNLCKKGNLSHIRELILNGRFDYDLFNYMPYITKISAYSGVDFKYLSPLLLKSLTSFSSDIDLLQINTSELSNLQNYLPSNCNIEKIKAPLVELAIIPTSYIDLRHLTELKTLTICSSGIELNKLPLSLEFLACDFEYTINLNLKTFPNIRELDFDQIPYIDVYKFKLNLNVSFPNLESLTINTLECENTFFDCLEGEPTKITHLSIYGSSHFDFRLFTEITSLQIAVSELNIEKLNILKKLQHLNILCDILSDLDIMKLKYVSNIKELEFVSNALTGSCLQQFPQLEHLKLELEYFDEHSLNYCKNLKVLHYFGKNFSTKNLSLNQLKQLTIHTETPNVDIMSLPKKLDCLTITCSYDQMHDLFYNIRSGYYNIKNIHIYMYTTQNESFKLDLMVLLGNSYINGWTSNVQELTINCNAAIVTITPYGIYSDTKYVMPLTKKNCTFQKKAGFFMV